MVGRFYSSSIWLYITRTAQMADDSAFRIGVLHLVARRATTKRLDSDSERARKRVSDSRFRSGFDAAISSVLTSVDLNSQTARSQSRPTCGWEGSAANDPIDAMNAAQPGLTSTIHLRGRPCRVACVGAVQAGRRHSRRCWLPHSGKQAEMVT